MQNSKNFKGVIPPSIISVGTRILVLLKSQFKKEELLRIKFDESIKIKFASKNILD